MTLLLPDMFACENCIFGALQEKMAEPMVRDLDNVSAGDVSGSKGLAPAILKVLMEKAMPGLSGLTPGKIVKWGITEFALGQLQKFLTKAFYEEESNGSGSTTSSNTASTSTTQKKASGWRSKSKDKGVSVAKNLLEKVGYGPDAPKAFVTLSALETDRSDINAKIYYRVKVVHVAPRVETGICVGPHCVSEWGITEVFQNQYSSGLDSDFATQCCTYVEKAKGNPTVDLHHGRDLDELGTVRTMYEKKEWSIWTGEMKFEDEKKLLQLSERIEAQLSFVVHRKHAFAASPGRPIQTPSKGVLARFFNIPKASFQYLSKKWKQATTTLLNRQETCPERAWSKEKITSENRVGLCQKLLSDGDDVTSLYNHYNKFNELYLERAAIRTERNVLSDGLEIPFHNILHTYESPRSAADKALATAGVQFAHESIERAIKAIHSFRMGTNSMANMPNILRLFFGIKAGGPDGGSTHSMDASQHMVHFGNACYKGRAYGNYRQLLAKVEAGLLQIKGNWQVRLKVTNPLATAAAGFELYGGVPALMADSVLTTTIFRRTYVRDKLSDYDKPCEGAVDKNTCRVHMLSQEILRGAAFGGGVTGKGDGLNGLKPTLRQYLDFSPDDPAKIRGFLSESDEGIQRIISEQNIPLVPSGPCAINSRRVYEKVWLYAGNDYLGAAGDFYDWRTDFPSVETIDPAAFLLQNADSYAKFIYFASGSDSERNFGFKIDQE